MKTSEHESSIAKKPYRSYVMSLLASAMITLLLLASYVYVYKVINRDDPFYELERYQLKKAERLTGLDTILVGDSSLGNGIDSRLFDKMCGTSSANLALTGLYGFLGDFNMIKKVIKQNTIRNVVIVHTLDILQRKPDYKAHLLSGGEFIEPLYPWAIQKQVSKNFLREIVDLDAATQAWKNTLRKWMPGNESEDIATTTGDIVNDYHRQVEPLDEAAKKKLSSTAVSPVIDPSQREALKALKALCSSASLNCIYAVGGLYAPILSNSKPMLAQTVHEVEAAGFILAGTPYALKSEEVGDSEDHPAPQYKQVLTAYYAKSVCPLLRRPQLN